MVRQKPFLHIIGLRPALEEWGRLHACARNGSSLKKGARSAHYDLFGPSAEALIERLKPALDVD